MPNLGYFRGSCEPAWFDFYEGYRDVPGGLKFSISRYFFAKKCKKCSKKGPKQGPRNCSHASLMLVFEVFFQKQWTDFWNFTEAHMTLSHVQIPLGRIHENPNERTNGRTDMSHFGSPGCNRRFAQLSMLCFAISTELSLAQYCERQPNSEIIQWLFARNAVYTPTMCFKPSCARVEYLEHPKERPQQLWCAWERNSFFSIFANSNPSLSFDLERGVRSPFYPAY